MKIPDPLLVVARNLGDLRDSVVFVGGMIRSLLVTDPAASGARATKDVDLITEVPSHTAYYALGAKLRSRGFREASEEGAPICRWIVEGVTTDVMPVDPAILGFSNVWYFGARDCAIALDSSVGTIHVQDAPHFCASKLEAFVGRAEGDLYHHDLEDFIAVVDGREELLDEIREVRAEGPTELVLGSAAKHPHPLVCGSYSVHTSEHALALGEAGIRKVASALRAPSRAGASLGGVS